MVETTSTQVEIRNNYNRVRERIITVARLAGRNPDDIRLVVVTKTKPASLIQSVIDAGATDLGENYVEEAIPKIQALNANRGIHWHMIGHVQSRKAQSVCEYFQFVHSLDSVKLAEKLSRSAQAIEKSLPIWMEFNTSGEESKSGWNIENKLNWGNLIPDIEKVFTLTNLTFLGVMTIPPYSTNAETSRLYYRRLREFQEFIIKQFRLSGFRELSMGMSSDFEVAIQEGSTCVRIGQAILGPRPG